MKKNDWKSLKTAILILNYNNYEDTINCMKSVESYNTAPVKFVIVDNASSRKNTVEELNLYFAATYQERYVKYTENIQVPLCLPYVSFLINSTNDGYAKGNNKGLQLIYLDDEIDKILILNNDIVFVEDIIPQLSFYVDSIENAGIVSPILYKRGMKTIDYECARQNVGVWHEILVNHFHYIFRLFENVGIDFDKKRYLLKGKNIVSKVIPIELPSGSCMLIKKSVFQSINSFDPNTFLYWEENILHKKIERIGKKNFLCTDLKCIHLGASSTSCMPNQFLVNCSLKSGCYYMKNYSGCSRIAYIFYKYSTYFFRLTVIFQKIIMNRNL